MFVCTMQPVVQPVVQPAKQPVNRLYRVNGVLGLLCAVFVHLQHQLLLNAFSVTADSLLTRVEYELHLVTSCRAS